MQPYPTVQNYAGYFNQPPYNDRLSILQNQYQQTTGQMPQTNQGILWVQGESGAKSYLVAPNTTVLLMDSETERFYIKTTDASGMPNLRTFEYKELGAQPLIADVPPEDKFVTREEYQSLSKKYDDIMEKLNALTEPKTKSKAKGGGADE